MNHDESRIAIDHSNDTNLVTRNRLTKIVLRRFLVSQSFLSLFRSLWCIWKHTQLDQLAECYK